MEGDIMQKIITKTTKLGASTELFILMRWLLVYTILFQITIIGSHISINGKFTIYNKHI